jgi:hypothetical protein
MKTVVKLFSKLALVAGISVAFAFAVNEAAACQECVLDPGWPCDTLSGNPDLYCSNYRVNVQGCAWGECRRPTNECHMRLVM